MNLSLGKLSPWRISKFVAACVFAAAFAWHSQKGYHHNSDAILVVVTVFSVLAGFMVTVMALVADERALRGSSSRHDKIYFQLIRRDLRRHRNLFYLYLIVLSTAFIGALDMEQHPPLRDWFERGVLFFGAIAMIYSFGLPSYLMRRHLDALEERIKAREAKENAEP